MRWPNALAVLLVAGCAGHGNWTKTGADDTAAARDYRDCREMADAAVAPEADIDQDILATRQGDWQRAGVATLQKDDMQQHMRGRTGAIIDACMKAKGYGRAP